MNIDNWYEVRADGEKVAAFAPISREASTKAFKLVDDTQNDLYREKVLQIVACPQEEIIFETHPTRLEVEPPVGCVTKLPYDLFVM
jgi:adenylate kinase